MKLAPVVLFTYNRPDHTRLTIEALKANNLAEDSDLIIFSDGPKTDNEESVTKLRAYLNSIDGFKSITIHLSETNSGLACSIINGVSKILSEYESVIVMEDDLVTSPFFLTYMNEALIKYANAEQVISIHGYNYPVREIDQETFFLRGADCWGWGTWKRGWKLFNENGRELLENIKRNNLDFEFNFNGTYPYLKMLEDQIAARNNSWAIRWHASAFIHNKLTLYPGESLVVNIGLDGSGTHCSSFDEIRQSLKKTKVILDDIPLVENIEVKKKIARYFEKKKSFITRVSRKVYQWNQRRRL